jgi:hypothetical protein
MFVVSFHLSVCIYLLGIWLLLLFDMPKPHAYILRRLEIISEGGLTENNLVDTAAPSKELLMAYMFAIYRSRTYSLPSTVCVIPAGPLGHSCFSFPLHIFCDIFFLGPVTIGHLDTFSGILAGIVAESALRVLDMGSNFSSFTTLAGNE